MEKAVKYNVCISLTQSEHISLLEESKKRMVSPARLLKDAYFKASRVDDVASSLQKVIKLTERQPLYTEFSISGLLDEHPIPCRSSLSLGRQFLKAVREKKVPGVRESNAGRNAGEHVKYVRVETVETAKK